MSVIKIFSTKNETVELQPLNHIEEEAFTTFIENNMKALFGVDFIKSNYMLLNEMIDSIGLDENHCPVILEYKKKNNKNIITQGLFYIDWLLTHRLEFSYLVSETLGHEYAQSIDWSYVSLICLAEDFTKYDIYAVDKINRNIQLIKYIKYKDLFLLEHLNNKSTKPLVQEGPTILNRKNTSTKSHLDKVSAATYDLRLIYDELCQYIEGLGPDVTTHQQKDYLAYKKVQNIICVEILSKQIILYLKLNPDTVPLEEGFTKNMRNIGHRGSGDLQVTIKRMDDLVKAKPIIDRAYYEN